MVVVEVGIVVDWAVVGTALAVVGGTVDRRVVGTLDVEDRGGRSGTVLTTGGTPGGKGFADPHADNASEPASTAPHAPTRRLITMLDLPPRNHLRWTG